MIKENDIDHEKVTLNSYDEEGQLLKTIITDTKNNTTDTTINKYNGAGDRIEKDVNGEKTYYYVVNDAVLYTYKITTDSSGTENRTITSQNVVAPDGSIISSKRSEGYYIYNLDLKGSTVSIVAPDGRYKLVYAYDIYGEPVKRGDKDFYNEITFTGAVYDESTGLYYMNARYYDPETGRFITEDSERGEFDDPLTQHLYAYCQNNPTNKVDPSGNISFRAICTIGGAVIGGAVGAYRSYKKTGKVRLKSVVVGAAIGAAVGFFGAKYGRKVYQAVKNSKKVGNIAHKVNSKTKPLRSKAKSAYKKIKHKGNKRTRYKDITDKGARYKNYQSNQTARQFKKTLKKRGYKKEIPKNYKGIKNRISNTLQARKNPDYSARITNYYKGNKKFTVRSSSKSTKSWTADFARRSGNKYKKIFKIRFR